MKIKRLDKFKHIHYLCFRIAGLIPIFLKIMSCCYISAVRVAEKRFHQLRQLLDSAQRAHDQLLHFLTILHKTPGHTALDVPPDLFVRVQVRRVRGTSKNPHLGRARLRKCSALVSECRLGRPKSIVNGRLHHATGARFRLFPAGSTSA